MKELDGKQRVRHGRKRWWGHEWRCAGRKRGHSAIANKAVITIAPAMPTPLSVPFLLLTAFDLVVVGVGVVLADATVELVLVVTLRISAEVTTAVLLSEF